MAPTTTAKEFLVPYGRPLFHGKVYTKDTLEQCPQKTSTNATNRKCPWFLEVAAVRNSLNCIQSLKHPTIACFSELSSRDTELMAIPH